MRRRVTVTAYEGSESNWRLVRIYSVLAAAHSFLANLDDDYSSFEGELISIHDHKGTLDVVWASQEALDEYARLIDLAWEYQGEASRNNHQVAAED